MSADLFDLGFLAAADALAKKSVSSEALTAALLDRSEQLEPALNSLTWFDREAALAQARAADAARAAARARRHWRRPARPSRRGRCRHRSRRDR